MLAYISIKEQGVQEINMDTESMPLEIESETRVSANMDRNTNRLLPDFRWDFWPVVANVGQAHLRMTAYTYIRYYAG